MTDQSAPHAAKLEAATLIRDTAFGKPVAELPRASVRRQVKIIFGENLDGLVDGVSYMLQEEYNITDDVAHRMAQSVLGLTQEMLKDDIAPLIRKRKPGT